MKPAAPAQPQDLHRSCFACGATNHAGLKLRFNVNAEGVACAEWLPCGEFESYPGRVHGGILATLLDSAIVHALFARGIAGVTAEMSIRYLQPVESAEPVAIRGWVESARHGVYRCGASLEQSGKRVARAEAKFMPIR